MAIILGTVGIGIISQLSNFSNLVVFVSTAGIPLGVTKYVSEWEKDGRWSEINEIMSKSLLLMISIGLIFLVATAVFSKQISLIILDSDSYSVLLVITASAFPLMVVVSVFEAFLRGLKRFEQYVRITILLSVLSLILCVTFVIFFSILGFVLSILISSLISIFIYVYFFKKNGILILKNLSLFDFKLTDPLKSILKLGAASLIAGVLEQLTYLSIRSLIIKDLGVELNGIYQCVAGISNNYFMFFYMSLGAYILPVLSEMKDINRMNDEINNVYRLTLLFIVPIITFTFVLRELIILMLYSSNFLAASDLMIYNFVGDYFKALSWVLGAWLIPQSKFRLWLIIGVIYYIDYFIIFIVLTHFTLDIKNVVLAYAFAGIIHFVLNLYFIKKLNKFQFQFDAIKLMAVSTIFLAIILIISSYEVYLGYFFAVPFFLVWLKLSVTKDEFYKFLSLIKLKR